MRSTESVLYQTLTFGDTVAQGFTRILGLGYCNSTVFLFKERFQQSKLYKDKRIFCSFSVPSSFFLSVGSYSRESLQRKIVYKNE